MEDGAPLCEEHDHPITRQRVRIERNLNTAQGNLGEAQARLPQMYHEGNEDKLNRLQKRIDKWSERVRKQKDKLSLLREQCDHEDKDTSSQEVTEDLFSSVPETEYDPESLPFTRYYHHCKLCGKKWEETK